MNHPVTAPSNCPKIDGGISGDNTDGVGLVRDLTGNLNLSLRQQKILILGAGGAVRGVLGPLLDLQPEEITIANRSLDKAHQLALDFSARGSIRVQAYADLGVEKFDLIINATAAGLQKKLPPIDAQILCQTTVCYDMLYSTDESTTFVDWAQGLGVRAHDGLGMLVEQAAESFSIWRGLYPQTRKAIMALRQS